jgi:3-mercaptopyruvate sulfurtransferase SseA
MDGGRKKWIAEERELSTDQPTPSDEPAPTGGA